MISHTFTSFVLSGVLLKITAVYCQSSTITVSVDAGTGLVYLLLVMFFGMVFCTPVFRYVYVKFIDRFVQHATQEVIRASRMMSNRISDLGHKTAQSIRRA